MGLAEDEEGAAGVVGTEEDVAAEASSGFTGPLCSPPGGYPA
jgi:hypothetical protein